MPNRQLVLVRHGESQGNRDNLFTGWLDLPLTDRGRQEARAAGAALRRLGVVFDVAFTSALVRTIETSRLLLAQTNSGPVETRSATALNERNYGDLAGLDKEQARAKFGADQIQQWRRAYAIAPPGGESLRDTAARVLPLYVGAILPAVMRGGATLVVAHGNSLRALVMTLDQLTPDQIERVEISTGEILRYSLNDDTTIASKEVLHA